MNRSLNKIFRREVGRSPGRFIAIFLIIVLGAGFFAGLQSAAPSMEATADSYFDSSRMADFRLLCTMGITEDDVAALTNLPEISEAVPGYREYVKASLGKQAATDIYAVHSLPEGTTGAGVTDGTITAGLSRPTLTKGRLPAAPNECLADAESDMKIGDTIVLSNDNTESTLKLLAQHNLIVVGLARSPVYFSPERGSTNSGDSVQNYLYVLPSAFDSDYYTDISLRMKDTDKYSAFSDDYETLVKKKTAALEVFLESRAKDRYDELYKVTPEWFIQSRDDLPGYSTFSSNAERIRNLSLIVPWFFFLIAALVCLTTMTRMVEEHRTRIGVLKALGYRRKSIMGRYQFYAWFIGIIGGGIGVAAGLYLFPEIIWNIYGTMYHMGDFILKISPIPCIIGMLGGTVAISIATAAACRSALSSNAAALMRPKAPKPGKRVLLERIPFIWHLLSFSQKVTIRNLFRYKNRFIMTIIGIAGCTALIVSGFGMRDSIGSMVDIQYGEVTPSRADIYLSKPSDAAADTPLNNLLAQTDCVFDYVRYDEADVSAGARNNNDMVAFLTIPEDPAHTDSFVVFSERVSHKPIAFPPDESSGPAVILTEQLAKSLDVSAGDRIVLGIKNEAKKEVRVAGVTENYISNYIYITPVSYEALFGSIPEFSTVLLNTDMSEAALDNLLTSVGADENVVGTRSTAPIRDIVDQIVENLSGVVNLIILVAAMLAFIVLYNLTNINITERERELATLKVLGFYSYEVDAYISRETMILTVIGTGIGLVGGIFLHDYVMGSVEVNNFMFPRLILRLSYVYAAAFTIICSFIIGLCMRPRLKRIDSVGSLKSVE